MKLLEEIQRDSRSTSWQEYALCSGQGDLYDAPALKAGAKYSRECVLEYRQRASLCLDCPVYLQCRELLKDKELAHWAIVAGEMPGVMKASDVKVSQEAPKQAAKVKTCARGHKRSARIRGCPVCKADMDRLRRPAETARRKEARLKARQEAGLALTDEVLELGICPNGHDISAGSSLTRLGACRVCSLASQQEKRRISAKAHYDRKAKARRQERRDHLNEIVRQSFEVG